MKINATNNANFNGIISLFRARKATKAAKALAQKAEDRLKSRLVHQEDLIMDVETGHILNFKDGSKFTGKFIIPTDTMEKICRVKDGLTKISFVRFKNGQKQVAFRNDIVKKFKNNIPEKIAKEESIKMCQAIEDAREEMCDKFVIKKLIDSGQESIMIKGKY